MFNSAIYINELDKVFKSFPDWSRLRNKTILFTGATGLIGSFFVNLLMHRNEKYKDNIKLILLVRNYSRAINKFETYIHSENLVIIEKNILEPIEDIELADFIIHAGSPTTPDFFAKNPVDTIKTNILSTLNILEYAKQNPKSRVLFLSSGEIYGEATKEAKSFNEVDLGYIDCNSPRACYSEGKRASESICASYKTQYDLDIVIARPCHIYGPSQNKNDNRVWAQFVQNAIDKKDIILKSDGSTIRSYCFVADCVLGLLYILLLGESGEAYNISNKNSIVSILEMAQAVSELSKKEVKFDIPKFDNEVLCSSVKRAVLDSSKLEELGFNPRVSIIEGFKKTIDIVRECL